MRAAACRLRAMTPTARGSCVCPGARWLPHTHANPLQLPLPWCAAEPLDASTSILLVYFEQVAAEAAAEPGMLCT